VIDPDLAPARRTADPPRYSLTRSSGFAARGSAEHRVEGCRLILD
jgi:hypothetical protein